MDGHVSAIRLRYSNSQNSTSRISGVGFFTLIQGISTATYLTLPRLPRRPIGPEPFQFNFVVPQRGLEPLTTRLQVETKIAVRIKYSIRLLFVLYHLSYWGKIKTLFLTYRFTRQMLYRIAESVLYGTPSETRTQHRHGL